MNNFQKLMILLLVASATTKMIIPDPTNPFHQNINTSKIKNNTVTLKFSLPAGQTLHKDNLLAVDFSRTGTALSSLANSMFSCSLTDSRETVYSVEGANYSTIPYRTYCKYTEHSKGKVIDSSLRLILKITFTIDIQINNWNQIGVLLVSSTNTYQMIMASNAFLAFPYSHVPFDSLSNNPMTLKSSSVKVSGGSNTSSDASAGLSIFVGDVFATEHSFSVNRFISKDSHIVIRFDETYVSAFDSATTIKKNDTDTILSGLFNKSVLGTGEIALTGLGQDIHNGTNFTFKFTGWTAKYKTIASSKLEFLVFYKNSKSVLSYASDNSTISIKKYAISSSSVNEAEKYPYLTSGMAWPLKFTIKYPLTMPSVHTLIEFEHQTNQILGFNAASCTFLNLSSEAKFGETPICFAHQSTTKNGFHFKMSSPPKDSTTELTIWVEFNKCQSGLDIDAEIDTFDFSVKMYPEVSNTDEMPTDTQIVADATLTSSFKCLQAVQGAETGQRWSNYNLSETTTVFIPYAREINNLELVKVNSLFTLAEFNYNVDVDGTVCDSIPGRIDHTTPNEISVETTTPRIYLHDNASYAATDFIFVLGKLMEASKINEKIPSDQTLLSNPDYSNSGDFVLEFGFQQKWYNQGKYNSSSDISSDTLNNLCFVQWDVTALAGTVQAKLNWDVSVTATGDCITDIVTYQQALDGSTAPTIATDVVINFLYQGTNSNIDSLLLPPQTSATVDYYFIKSKTKINATKHRFSFPGKLSLSQDDFNFFYIFTTCLSLKTDISTFKTSVFEYFEITAMVKHSLKDNKPVRLIRMLTFLSMGDVFSQKQNQINFATGSNIYPANANLSYGYQGVCLTSLDKVLSDSKQTDSNTLVVFLTHIKLFETDFSKTDNSYPIPHLNTGVKAYGFSTDLTLHISSFKVDQEEFKNASYFATANNVKMNISDYFTASSQVWFTSVSSLVTKAANVSTKILIPHYCNEGFSSKDNFPGITYTWFTATNYQTLKFSQGPQDGTNPAFKLTDSTVPIQKKTDFTEYHLQLKPYIGATNIVVDASKSIKIGSYTNVNNYSVAVLLNSLFTLESNAALGNFQTDGNGGFASVPFYFMKIPFGHILLSETDSANEAYNGTVVPAVGETLNVQNVTRPDLSKFLDQGMLYLQNRVIVSATGFSNANETIMSTNAEVNSKVPLFLADLENVTTSWTVSYANMDNFYYDKYNRVEITAANVASAPGMSFTIELNTSKFASSALCGLKSDGTDYVHNCVTSTSGTSKVFTCKSPFTKTETRNISICCFNLSFDTPTAFSIEKINSGYTKSTEVASTNWTLAYTTNNNTPSEVMSGITIQATETPKVVSFTFNQATTIEGVGYVIIQVSLTRQLGPSMLLEVTGQLSELSVFNETPNCIATTSSTGNYGNYVFGDEIIDECRVKQFSTANAVVEVSTKSSIFSCLSKYSETLYIKLGPVRVVDVTKYDYSARLSIDNDAIGIGTPSKPASNLTTPTDNVIVADTGDSQPVLCNPETIFPLVVGAKANITFKINMAGFLETLDSFRKRPNEISFYFPTKLFGFLPESLECSTSLTNVEPDCQVNENNILNVGLKSYVVAKTSSFFITISGLPVPRMNSEEFSYICTLNNISFDGAREVLVIGKGERGSEISNEGAYNGRLVFFNLGTTAYEARNYRGMLEFAFTVDRASNHSFEGKEMTNTPSIVFEFPSNYPLKGADVSVELKEIKEDTSSSTFSLLAEEVKAFGTVQPIGHIISISLKLTSAKFQVAENIHYYKVKMLNLPFPTEALVESGALQVYLVDSNDSTIFRTYLNTNNQFNNAIIEGTQSGLLNMYRGFTFNFPSEKLKVDLTKENNESKLDIIAGFYSPFKYTIKNFATNVEKEEELSLRFSMTPTNLKLRGDTMDDSNLIVFSGSDTTSFEMAVSCKTQVGQYFLEIEANAQSATSRMLFVKRHPVEVKFEKKVIDCSIPANIPKNSRVKFICMLPETLDSVNLTFSNSNSSDSFSLGSITCHLNGQLAVCEFHTAFNSNLIETSVLNFIGQTGNDCVRFGIGGDSQLLSFNLIAPVDQGISQDDLKLVEFKTVAQESSLKYDEIMVMIDAPQYSEIACVMSCPTETLPEISELLAFNKNTDSDQQKWRYTYSSNSETKPLIFNGLQRAVNYKLFCAISSINTKSTRIFYSKEADTLKNGEETDAQIRLSESNTTRCLDFTFSRKIEDEVERGLVSYCNNLYGPGNGIKTGCIVCTDYQKKYLSKGYKVDQPECALQPKLRRLQDTTTTTEGTATTEGATDTTTENTEIQQQEAQFTVCAVQDLFCSTQLEENTNAQLFNSFSSAVEIKEKMIKSLGIPENSLQDFTLKQVLKVEDGVAPDMTLCSGDSITVDCVKIVKQEFKILGDYHVQLQFGGDYQCLYKVKQTDDTLQTLEDMRKCKTDEMCGNFLTSIIAVSDLNNLPNPSRLVHNQEYELLLACFQKKVLLSKYENTNVLRLSKFTVSRPEKNCPRPDLDIDPYKEGICYCEDSNKRVVEQGIDARDCLSTFLAFSFPVFLLFLIA